MKPAVLFIVGPTAVGKSDIALWIAKKIKGEIVSADSMMVYKGMDIGTAKPSKRERQGVRHHLIDVRKPGKNFSVFEYRLLALKAIESIFRRKKIPIVVGGSGLYVRALLQGLAEYSGADMEFREQLEARIKSEGTESLYRELAQIAPERAEKIKSTDVRRIIRAFEIERKNPGEKKQKSLKDLGYRPIVVGINKDRAELYRDIEKRVDRMFEKGLIKEVRGLYKKKLSPTSLQAVGYKELIAAFAQEYDLERARELIKTRSRQLAKRQWTWFKREEGLFWVNWGEGDTIPSIGARILAHSGMNL